MHIQAERRGTADAVKAARFAIEAGADDILVVFGDTPFITKASIAPLRAALREGRGGRGRRHAAQNPFGYGRLLMHGDRLAAIREERDASDEERTIGFVNGGVMALAGGSALEILDAIDDRNDQKEFYLTDAVEVANAKGLKAVAVEIDADEVFGINDRAQLAEAERLFQAGRRREAMLAGVTLIAPETVFFAYDTAIGSDVTIEPNVVFGPGVTSPIT